MTQDFVTVEEFNEQMADVLGEQETRDLVSQMIATALRPYALTAIVANALKPYAKTADVDAKINGTKPVIQATLPLWIRNWLIGLTVSNVIFIILLIITKLG